ncbi:LOW QUALITY PROTEIN: Helitron helicase, partial [Phytophthora megakarya]
MHEFTSMDSVDGDDKLQRQEHGDLYPPKFLNIISLSGMPSHKLNLKDVGPKSEHEEGICNGIRLRIVRLRPNYMESALMSVKTQVFRSNGKESILGTGSICDDDEQIA